MTFTLTMLALAAAITFFMAGFQGLLVPLNQGIAWGLGARDEGKDVSALQGRAARCVANQIENMAVFVPLVLIAHLAGLQTAMVEFGAALFVAARLAFFVFYWLGVPVLRSLAWLVGVIAMMLIAIPVFGAGIYAL
ncbi:MAG: MAPEG family protein [Pseudomonadota bacterium]